MRNIELEALLKTANQSLGTTNKSLVTATNKAQELESSLAMANVRAGKCCRGGPRGGWSHKQQNYQSWRFFESSQHRSYRTQTIVGGGKLKGHQSQGSFGQGQYREAKPPKYTVQCNHLVHGKGLASAGSDGLGMGLVDQLSVKKRQIVQLQESLHATN
jgi:hypothetical protein